MVPGGVLLCLVIGAVGAVPPALVLMPSEIQLGIPEKVCVVQAAGDGAGSFRVTIRYPPSNTTLLDQETAGIGRSGCVEFTAPDVPLRNDVESVATVAVTGAMNVTKDVLLRKYSSLTFVQTDKPVYKPGQTVRFRIVSLTQDFRPSYETYPLITLWRIGSLTGAGMCLCSGHLLPEGTFQVPGNGALERLYDEDPQRNRIGQWRDVEGRQGIVDLSFDLISEPPMGTYEIRVEKSSGKVEHRFSVEEYVLPTFEVDVQLPELITILHKRIPVKVCGRYTYGKPLRGHVNGTVCLRWIYPPSSPELCHVVTGKMDDRGCFSKHLPMAKFKLKKRWWDRIIQAHFVLEEEGTGIIRENSAECKITAEVTQISFEEVDDNFKKAIPFTGKVKVKYSTGEPFANATVHLSNSFVSGVRKLVTDEGGVVEFTYDTSTWENQPANFEAVHQFQSGEFRHLIRKPDNSHAWHTAKPFYSKSGSFIAIGKHHRELPCESDLEVPVRYILKVLPDSEPLDLEVFQLVMSKGKIVSFEKTVLSVRGTDGSEGSFSLTLRISPDLAPVARMLVFAVLPAGEMIGDAVRYSVGKCFRNKVQLRFSSSEDLPGTPIGLDIRAEQGSFCGLRVVDQSVLLLKPEEELSVNSVYSLLPVSDLSGYNYLLREDSNDVPPGAEDCPFTSREMSDINQLLEDMGLRFFKDFGYHCQMEGYFYDSVAYDEMVPMLAMTPHLPRISETAPPVQKIREYFPETWLWDLIPVRSTGHAALEATVPDSITEWKGSVFCTGEPGFGMSETVSFVAFKPFFVSLALPYSVIRTEGFTLQAKVFNYMAQSLMVKVTLLEAQGFELKSSNRELETCVLSKDSVTVGWNLTASALGEVNVTVRAEAVRSPSLCGNEVVTVPVKGAVDIIRKPVLIEPEGSETELSHSSLLCPAGETISEQIRLQVPEDVVEGSARAYVTVLGDLMGSAMENLDGLLRLPTGCGEQNMVKFAPNIYVLSYLQKTQQLTPEIKSKAIGFLQTGYQRQLTYKHHDGSYSAFGNSDTEGNTWLTAFVLKSFLHAQPYIFIDDSVLRAAAGFFLKYRLESGCFASLGQLFNNAMKGGVDDHISLSAYVTAALVEILRLRPTMASQVYEKTQGRDDETSSNNESEYEVPLHTWTPSTDGKDTKPLKFKTEVVDVSLGCLRREMEAVNNTYTLALLAYTFTLAGDTTSRERLLNRLEALAVTKDGLKHWQRAGGEEEEKEVWFWWRAPSAEVEMTAYVLLALLSKLQVSASDLQQAVPIVSWLVRQRNAYGGFASTQDTVVALHALSLYGGLTHATDTRGSVSLTGKKGFRREFQLDASNQLLLQRESLEDVPGDYTVQISGTSCLLLQTTLRYNTPPTPKPSAFRLSVNMETEEWDQTAGKVNINVSYVGSRNVSNMVIVDLKLLSGYSAEKPSHPSVSRTETQNDHLVMYIRQMEAFHPVQLSVAVHRDFEVDNLQEAHVKVYDYYETDESAIAGYHVNPSRGHPRKVPARRRDPIPTI